MLICWISPNDSVNCIILIKWIVEGLYHIISVNKIQKDNKRALLLNGGVLNLTKVWNNVELAKYYCLEIINQIIDTDKYQTLNPIHMKIYINLCKAFRKRN